MMAAQPKHRGAPARDTFFLYKIMTLTKIMQNTALIMNGLYIADVFPTKNPNNAK